MPWVFDGVEDDLLQHSDNTSTGPALGKQLTAHPSDDSAKLYGVTADLESRVWLHPSCQSSRVSKRYYVGSKDSHLCRCRKIDEHVIALVCVKKESRERECDQSLGDSNSVPNDSVSFASAFFRMPSMLSLNYLIPIDPSAS